ncbi:hypothetical protein [Methylocaldum sp.]|uniref:hypothetical protein n=1 Tax=Methylocaldum sp. TaxID=1969727 RepID=UPI002D51C0B4|nr:hypothetical protein [Methylocaldum sp.]HYE34500.1 hypothetical protein [Methylocaldum sp.]
MKNIPVTHSTPPLITRLMVWGALASLLLLTVGCATNIKPTTAQNPPPKEKFSAFNRFELHPLLAANATVAEEKAALAKIQENLDEQLKSRLDQWNAKPVRGPSRTLVIEPIVTDLKFVGGGTRFFAGALAGSSAVVMRARFKDKETQEEVAYPELYAHAAAMGGAFSVGGTDNAMLVRIANSLAAYVFTNYKQAVGGPVMPPEVEAASIATE